MQMRYKKAALNPRGGRLKIAQRFIAAIVQMEGTQSVKRTVENVDFMSALFSRPLSRTTTASAC
jgi:hypothetical protein